MCKCRLSVATVVVNVLPFNVTAPETVSGEPAVNFAKEPLAQVTLPEIVPVPPKVPLLVTVTSPGPVPDPVVLLTSSVPLVTIVPPE